MDPQVFMMWFKKGSSVSVVICGEGDGKDGIPVTATTSIDSIFQFAKEHMDPEEVEDHKVEDQGEEDHEVEDHEVEDHDTEDHKEETEQDEVDL